jgi:hypothetical protein
MRPNLAFLQAFQLNLQERFPIDLLGNEISSLPIICQAICDETIVGR